MLVALVVFVGAQMLAPTYSLADVLRCTIENYGEDVYITTPPDTNSSDGQYARIGISRGTGNRAIVVADRMGATAFVECRRHADWAAYAAEGSARDQITSVNRYQRHGFRTTPKSGRLYSITLIDHWMSPRP